MLLPEKLKEIQYTMWSYGDYSKVAKMLNPGAVELVERLKIHPGQTHLDVATGNGNVAILSAMAGANVTGIDLTDVYFEEARNRANSLNLNVDFQEGDIEQLQFGNDSFDFVTSTYGIQFVPHHEKAVLEISRICKAGGIIGMCNWTPQSWTAHFEEIISSYFPAPPEYTAPAMLWGDELYINELFGDNFEISTERLHLDYIFLSPEGLITFFESCFGPFIAATRSISPQSRWFELREELIDMTEEFFYSDKTGSLVMCEYLLVLAKKKGDNSE